METIFFLVRHGQTAANASGILQGQLNTDLDGAGIRQAECAAERMKSEKIDRIFSSDLLRAMHTAEIISSRLGIPAEPLPELREWDLGELQGCPVKELWENFPHVMNAFKYDGSDFTVPGGESRGSFNRRITSCLDMLAETNPGRKLLLVSHAGPMRAVFRHIVGTVRPGVLLPATVNASISSFCRRDGEWQLRSWNDTSHLAAVHFRESVTF